MLFIHRIRSNYAVRARVIRRLKKEPVDWNKMLNPGNFGFALISTDSDVMNFKTQRSYEIFLDLSSNDFRSDSGRHLFSYGFGFTIGPVVNLNACSSIVNKYRLNDEKQKDKYKRAHCNLATVDLMFQLNFRDVGVYAKYSPMNIMDTDYTGLNSSIGQSA